LDNQNTNHAGAKNKKQNSNKANPYLQNTSATSVTTTTANTTNSSVLA